MPHKVGFRVVYVSGEDEQYRAKELNTHGPTVKGWQSPKFCLYPQELVIQLDYRTDICKIQILSHQSLIATKIELYVGDLPDKAIQTPQNAKYRKLGYVSLSDNERTTYKARELKSVHVDAIGTFVKLIIHKNHVNRNNLCNQVGIIALNVIGDEIVKKQPSSNGEAPINGFPTPPTNSLFQRRPDYISPLDDLAFDMYQDPETALIIRKLEAMKQEAVFEEKYEFAKKLKNTIIELHKAGEKLGKYEIEKRQVTEMEDFEKAQQKQKQMEDYRMDIYEHLELHRLLGDKVIKPRPKEKNKEAPKPPSTEGETSPPVKAPIPKSATPKPPTPQLSSPPTPPAKPISPPVPAARMPSVMPLEVADDIEERTVSPNSNLNSYEAYENRTVPALRNREAGSENAADEEDEKSMRGTHKGGIVPKDRREAMLPIAVFGLETIEDVYSKTFTKRDQALKVVHRHLRDFDPAKADYSAVKLFRAATFVVSRVLKDKVLTVFTEGLNVLTTLFTRFPYPNKISRNELSSAVDKILPELIIRSGDSAPRIRTTAMNYIMTMTEFPEVQALQVVPSYLCKPMAANVTPRLAQSRAELVGQLVTSLGVDKQKGMTVSMVMDFCLPALEHPVGPVRETAERIIVSLYWQRGREIRKFLPIDDEKTRRNVKYRQLFEDFDKIDQQRVLTKTNRKTPARKGFISDGSKTLPVPKKANRQAKPYAAALQVDGDDIINLDTLEKTCIFCGQSNESFSEDGLDYHYWKSCPMLVRCSHCKQVVEIASLTEHLLSECIAKDQFERCERCQEAIPRKGYETHVRLKTCLAAKPEKVASHCPLCHQNIPPGDEGWKDHLMGRDGCPNNPRRRELVLDGRSKRRPGIPEKARSVERTAAAPPRAQELRPSRSSSQKLTATTSLRRR